MKATSSKALLSENSKFRVESRDYREWDEITTENDASWIWYIQVALLRTRMIIHEHKFSIMESKRNITGINRKEYMI